MLMYSVCLASWWYTAHFRDELVKYEGRCISDINDRDLNSHFPAPHPCPQIKSWLYPCTYDSDDDDYDYDDDDDDDDDDDCVSNSNVML